LTQMDAYLRMEGARFPTDEEKVMFVSTFLRGPALDWFEPILRDRLECSEDAQDVLTKEVFGNYDEFKRRLERTLLRVGSNRSRRYLTMVVREGSRSLLDSVSFTSTRRSNRPGSPLPRDNGLPGEGLFLERLLAI
ncbi:hypothetical protein T310_8931, partial [Rasamsonia emersonii CBS 393.64]